MTIWAVVGPISDTRPYCICRAMPVPSAPRATTDSVGHSGNPDGADVNSALTTPSWAVDTSSCAPVSATGEPGVEARVRRT